MNYFGTNYQPIYPQMQQPIMPTQNQSAQSVQPTVPTIQSFNNGGQFFFVNSREEAEKWVVNQGQTVYLFDVNNGVFFEKSVGKNGLPQPLQTYTYKKEEIVEDTKEDEVIEYVTKEEFLEMENKLKSEIKKLKPLNTPKKKEVKKDE